MKSNHKSGQTMHSLAKRDMLADPEVSYKGSQGDKSRSYLLKPNAVMRELPTEEPLHYIPSINLDVICGYKVA